jgi:hypothetical protein
MKKTHLSLVITLTMLFTLTGAHAQKLSGYACKWHASVATLQEEELINQMQLEDKSQFLFMISNDENSLYIELIVADQAAVQKIMRYGLTTWFNPEAKHKKALGIEFPVTTEGQASEPNYMRDKNVDRKEMRNAMMSKKNQEMTLIGFDAKDDRKSINPTNSADFHGNVEMMEGGRLHISLSLPLAKLQRPDLASFTNPLGLGFETGYMDVTGSGMSSGGGQPSGGGGGGGGGGMYGGGPGGGGPPGGSGQGQMGGTTDQQQRPDIGQLASPTRLWIKEIKLATK